MTSKTSAPHSMGLQPAADFGTRFSAFMIDAVLLFSMQWVIFIVLSRQLQAAGLTATEQCDETTAALCEGPSTLLWAILLMFLLVSTVGYHAVFEGRYGATPGKRWMGLAVVSSTDQSPIGLSAGLLRSIVRQSFWLSLFFVLDVSPLSLGLPAVLFIALPLLMLVVFVIGAINPTGQAGHDLVAKTYVVHSDELKVPPQAPEAQAPQARAPQAQLSLDPTELDAGNPETAGPATALADITISDETLEEPA